MDSKRSNVVLVVALVVAVVSLVVGVLAASQASSLHRKLADEVAYRKEMEKGMDFAIYLAAYGQSSSRVGEKVEKAGRGFALQVERLETMVRALYRERGMKFEQE